MVKDWTQEQSVDAFLVLNEGLTDYVPLLQVEAAQMFKRVLCIHHIIKHHKGGSTRLLVISQPYLPYPTVSPKEVVQVLARNVVG